MNTKITTNQNPAHFFVASIVKRLVNSSSSFPILNKFFNAYRNDFYFVV